ncbi:MAG: alpha/beta hydrolase-fold protein [Bacteroidota bacterium]
MQRFLLTVACLLLSQGCGEPDQSPEMLTLSSGTVQRIENFPSEFIAPRNVDVWLPDGYSTDQQYAVLYLHDGQMLFDSTTTWNKQEWGVDEKMGQLLSAEEIRPTIVVGIWSTDFRHSEYFPQKPFERLPQAYQDSLITKAKRYGESPLFQTKVISDNYLKFLVKELKPHIDQTYSTHSEVDNTFIAGSSMGGLISMYALCEYPDVFSAAACMSTHWVGTFDTLNNPIPDMFAEYMKEQLPDPKTHRIYFDFGTETLDAFYEPFQRNIDSVMIKKGYDEQNWQTLKFEGANHSERAWNKRLEIPLKFLLGKEE